MRIAFVIYHQMVTLSFAGVFDVLSRVKKSGLKSDLELTTIAPTAEVVDGFGLRLYPTQIGQPLGGYDWVIIPGAHDIKQVLENNAFLEWLRTAESARNLASACTGSLLLGALGWLKGKKATTHPHYFSELQKFGVQVENERVVEDGRFVTARGVTASIDLGLHLCEKIAGWEAKDKIQERIDYWGFPQKPETGREKKPGP